MRTPTTIQFSSLMRRVFSAAFIVAVSAGQAVGAEFETQLANRVIGVPERHALASELPWTKSISEIQQSLFDLGLFDGQIDGRLTSKTLDAIRRYQRRHGVIDTVTAWPSLLVHMRAIGEAARMQGALKEARSRQIDIARARLLEHGAARKLVGEGMRRDVADPTRDSEACFEVPDMRCILDEALESIRAVGRAKYRDWALQDLIAVFARAGMIEPLKDAVRRLSDPRLVLVVLRESVLSMAADGRVLGAEEVLLFLPAGEDRARALAGLARGWLARGAGPRARRAAERVLEEIAGLDRSEPSVRIAASLAIAFGRAGDDAMAGRARAASESHLLGQDAGGVPGAAFAKALAELGQIDRALRKLDHVEDESMRRPALISLVSAHAGRRAVDQAIAAAGEIDIPRYRVIALCDGARRLAAEDEPAAATRMLDAAVTQLAGVEGEYASDFAWACVAKAYAEMDDGGRAEGAARHIESVALRARTLWRIAGLRRAAGALAEAMGLEETAQTVTGTVDSFKRVSILSEISIALAREGRGGEARVLMRRALDSIRGIKTRWWRARALCRVAAALFELELHGVPR